MLETQNAGKFLKNTVIWGNHSYKLELYIYNSNLRKAYKGILLQEYSR